MSEWVALRPETADRLERDFNTLPPSATGPGRGSGSRKTVLVKCLSATATGAGAVSAKCYSAAVLDQPAVAASPEGGGAVWLTLWGDGGTALVPVPGLVYAGLLAGEFDGRPRVYSGDVPCGSLLCEVTVSGTAHTVKRMTYSSGIFAYSPTTTFTNCRSTTGSNIAVGQKVMLDPIPDVSGNYWITPVEAGGSETYGTDALSTGALDITSDDTWTDTGSTVTLSAAGTYLIGYAAGGLVYATALASGDSARLVGKIESSASGGPIRNFHIAAAPVTNRFCYGTAGGSLIYTSAGSDTLKIQAMRHSGPTWSQATIHRDPYTDLNYWLIE